MKASINFRTATHHDAATLTVLSIQVWLTTYAKEGVKAEYADFVMNTFNTRGMLDDINNPEKIILVAEQAGVLQGYLLANKKSHYQGQPEYGYEVERLYVDAKFKGLGIGKALLQKVQKEFGSNFWLYTWVENDANSFYQHIGLSNIGQFVFNFHDAKIHNWVYSSTNLL